MNALPPADAKPRSIFSIAALGLTLGPVIVMLWLGRGKLALLYLAAIIAVSFATGFLECAALIDSRPVFLTMSKVDLLIAAAFNIGGFLHALKIRRESLARPWYRWIAAAYLALLVFVLPVRTFLFQPFSIPSASGYPNLVVGDYVFVSKFTYGYSRYSFPFNLASFEGRIWGGHPRRGDIAVFKLPTDTNLDYVKRVVGLPGDRIQMVNGVLHINGTPVTLKRIEDYVDTSLDGEGGGQPIPQFIETLPNGASYRILDQVPDGNADNTQEFVVPPGMYFTLGDNRDNSEDSRFLDRVGYIPEENFIGPVVWLFWNSEGVPTTGRP